MATKKRGKGSTAAPKKEEARQLIIFDTETTGLPLHPNADLTKQPHIIEFGGTFLSLDDGRELGKVHFVIDPGAPITAEITKITGITEEDVQGKPTFGEVWPAIRAAFDSCAGCLAHNSPFDETLINFELRRLGITDFVWPRTRLCTIGLYRAEYGHDMKLVMLYERVMGRKIEQKHRADSDVAMLVEIAQKERIWELVA